MEKLWAGRTETETAKLADAFNSSIAVDGRMYKEDITGSMAHAAMLGRQGIIEEHEAEKIIEGLHSQNIMCGKSRHINCPLSHKNFP